MKRRRATGSGPARGNGKSTNGWRRARSSRTLFSQTFLRLRSLAAAWALAFLTLDTISPTTTAKIVSRHYQTKGKPPADVEPVDRWFLKQRVTPLIPVNDFARASQMPALQTEFLTDRATWKNTRP